MKKKKKKKILEWILFMGLILFLIFITFPRISEPHFEIYEEECWDKIIGRKLIETKTIYCDKTITAFVTCGGDYKNCYEDSPYRVEFDCDTDLCEYPLKRKDAQCYDYKIEIRKENYSYLMEFWEDIYKQTCELVEVEDNVIAWCYDNNVCGYVKIGEEPWKEDWLNKNCECIKCPEYYAIYDNKCVYAPKKDWKNCQEYKCGDYFVEVKK